jgi:ABC-type transport system involved in cytochrome c biogenesis permease component
MSFLPIVERELRVSARRTSTYWLRCLVALAGVVIFAGLLLNTRMFPSPVVMGKNLFSSLSVLTLIYCLIEGVRETADCLSEEKREGTLGLLFLTDLRGYDVVLGKLLATSLRCGFAFLAVYPVLAITQLMGGVEPGFFWKTILALTHALFFSLATGMFVSALSRDALRAMIGTASLVGGLCFLPSFLLLKP